VNLIRNVDAWYGVWKIDPRQKQYLAPADRVRIKLQCHPPNNYGGRQMDNSGFEVDCCTYSSASATHPREDPHPVIRGLFLAPHLLPFIHVDSGGGAKAPGFIPEIASRPMMPCFAVA
jgi:hypothetical protein